MSALFHTWPERSAAVLDIGLLLMRDCACLRLLDRYEAATAEQLAVLVRPSRRTSLRRLRHLWRLGLLERSPLMPEHGGIPMAYCLSRRGRSRLGVVDPRARSAAHLRHSLDIVEVVCCLVAWSRHREDTESAEPLVQAWLPESMTVGILAPRLRPDSILALQAGPLAAALCVEVDEATEKGPVICAKLDAYDAAFAAASAGTCCSSSPPVTASPGCAGSPAGIAGRGSSAAAGPWCCRSSRPPAPMPSPSPSAGAVTRGR